MVLESLTIVHGVDRDKNKSEREAVLRGWASSAAAPGPFGQLLSVPFPCDISHESDFSRPDSSSKTTGPTADSLQS
jgi:hypothetical protein